LEKLAYKRPKEIGTKPGTAYVQPLYNVGDSYREQKISYRHVGYEDVCRVLHVAARTDYEYHYNITNQGQDEENGGVDGQSYL
jgi:hypothetical protein